MTLFRHLWKELVMLFSISISIVILMYIYEYKLAEEEYKFVVSSGELKEINNKYLSWINLKKEWESNKGDLTGLEENPVNKEENRLEWLLAMEDAAHYLDISSIQYAVEPREEINSDEFVYSYPGYTVYRSMMSLDMDLLHGGEIFDFFVFLKNRLGPVFDIYSCSVKRLYKKFDAVLASGNKNNIRVHCEIAWISMVDKIK